jgi:hypothetical protein
LGSLTGLLPGWHWTYAFVFGYGLVAACLYGLRRGLIKKQTAHWKAEAGGDEFSCTVKARFGVAGAILLGLALICMFIGADQDGLLAGKVFDDASIFLLTASLIEMQIYPWSAAVFEIGTDLHPRLYNASQKKLTGDWAGQPTILVISLDHIRIQGKRLPKLEGLPPTDQHLDLYRFYLGDHAFEQLLAFVEKKAHVHLPLEG